MNGEWKQLLTFELLAPEIRESPREKEGKETAHFSLWKRNFPGLQQGITCDAISVDGLSITSTGKWPIPVLNYFRLSRLGLKPFRALFAVRWCGSRNGLWYPFWIETVLHACTSS